MATNHVMTVCPSCGTENRIPVERIGQQGRCGRCKADLPPGGFHAAAPIEVGDGRFDIVTRLSALPVLVDFWADWCAPCRALAPLLDRLAAEEARRLLVLKVDTEQAVLTANRFGIQAIPTLLLLRSGIEVERIRGLVSLEAIRERIQPFL